MLNQMDFSHLQWAVNHLLPRDFAPDEVKTMAHILPLWQQQLYTGYYTGMAGGDFRSYALLVLQPKQNLVLLDYFAIHPGCRGKGYGSRVLSQLVNKRLPYWVRAMYVEIEDPATATTPAQAQLRQRRLQFYTRLGAVPCGVGVQVFGVDYQLLCFVKDTNFTPTPQQCLRDYSSIYKNLLPPQLFQTQFVPKCNSTGQKT